MKKSKKNPKVGDKYEIPLSGSLGLMAVGYKGLMKWRKKVLNIEGEDGQIIGPIFKGVELKVFSTAIKKPDEEK